MTLEQFLAYAECCEAYPYDANILLYGLLMTFTEKHREDVYVHEYLEYIRDLACE